MSSNAPGKCCISGVTHEGKSKGSWTEISSTKTYIAKPQTNDPKKAILFLTDAFGPDLINNQLMADDFAENGYLVVMPDLFRGNPVPARVLDEGLGDFDLGGWVASHPTDVVDPVVEQVIKEMRGQMGVKRLAAVGYCFGAKPLTRCLDDRNGDKVDVGYVAHPSLTTKEEIAAMHGPFAIGAAEVDHIFQSGYRHEVEGILAERKQPYQITLYGGVNHGFAVRADLKEKAQVVAKENAFNQAVQWFETYL